MTSVTTTRQSPAQARSDGQERRGRFARRAAGGALALAVAGVLAIILGVQCAKPLLFVEGGARRGDVIVILGGDAGDRVFRALELYKGGAAPKILITGDGDCYMIRDRFLLAGVSSNALIMEPKAGSTEENAAFSVRLMEERGMSRAIVVTSWYHSRRALACFRHFGPDLEFSSYPAYHGPDMEHKPGSYELPHVFREYPALAWYLLRYGITPTGKLISSS